MTVTTAGDGALRERLFDAALRCVARWGVAKTTLDDVAREAGCSRATLYRTFRGGKGALLGALARRELARATAAIDDAARSAATLEDLLVAGLTTATGLVRDHDALQFLLAHEPDVVLPRFAFHRLHEVLAAASSVAVPHLVRFLPPDEAEAAAEWLARLVISHALVPSDRLDLRQPAQARRFVQMFVLPGLTARHPQPTGA